MAITIRDVAQRAGVSIKTVSRVINNQGEITEATRSRVQSVITEMKYRPSELARGMTSGKSATIGLLIPGIADPFFPEVALGIEHVARAHGYSLFLCNTNNDALQELEYVDVLEGKRVEGVILFGSRLNTDQLAQVATRHNVAFITSRSAPGAAIISIPGEQGLFAMTSHLIQLGHRMIGHVGMHPGGESERTDGYLRALAAHNLPDNPRYQRILPDHGDPVARTAARELLQQAPELTAITCYNDMVAVEVLHACRELGRRVPEDVAVVGFDDIPVASLVSPALTTMRVPRYALGEQIMQLLLRVIAAGGKLEAHHAVPLELIIRDSCGALALPTRA